MERKGTNLKAKEIGKCYRSVEQSDRLVYYVSTFAQRLTPSGTLRVGFIFFISAQALYKFISMLKGVTL